MALMGFYGLNKEINLPYQYGLMGFHYGHIEMERITISIIMVMAFFDDVSTKYG